MKKKAKKLSEMTERELREYILNSKSEQRELLDLAVAEERELTEAEQSQIEDSQRSVNMAEAYQIACLRALPSVTPGEEATEVRKVEDIFATNLRSAVESGAKNARVEVRANIPIDSADIVDTIPVLFQDILNVLEPALIITKVGSKMLTNVQGTPTWPTVGDVEASFVGENVSLVDKTIDFSALRATPHRMGLKIKVSRRALNQSNLSLYNIVVQKIGASFAALMNKALVSFTKVAAQAPTGVFVAPALDPVKLSEYPTLKEVVSLETAIMDKNVETDANGFGAYIISTSMRGKLKTTPIEKGSPKMILEGNEMNGYPVVVSNYMPQDSIGFGFFEYSVLSQFGEMSLIVDPYTGAGENEIKFVGNTEVDITILRPEGFTVGTYTAIP